ncbi:MAG: type II toxin-antitoxin system RelE/ParE family toxin [Candidatus Binataceae bacterium]
MKRQIVFRDLAVRDLDSQVAYIADHQDAETARAYLAAASETIAVIAAHPSIGRVNPYPSQDLGQMRMIRVARFISHLIFYRVELGAIEIVRVIHGARDLENLFDE